MLCLCTYVQPCVVSGAACMIIHASTHAYQAIQHAKSCIHAHMLTERYGMQRPACAQSGDACKCMRASRHAYKAQQQAEAPIIACMRTKRYHLPMHACLQSFILTSAACVKSARTSMHYVHNGSCHNLGRRQGPWMRSADRMFEQTPVAVRFSLTNYGQIISCN